MSKKPVCYPKIGDDFFTALAVLKAEKPEAGIEAITAAMKERFPEILDRDDDYYTALLQSLPPTAAAAIRREAARRAGLGAIRGECLR